MLWRCIKTCANNKRSTMKFEYQETIDEYVLGRMPKAKRSSFENDIKTNSELNDQLQYTQNLKNLMSDRAEKLKLMQKWDEERNPKSHIWFWSTGIAAVLILGVYYVIPFNEDVSPSPDFNKGYNIEMFQPVFDGDVRNLELDDPCEMKDSVGKDSIRVKEK